jgi:transcriptional regulator with XRE-family HTH domain
MTAILGIAYSEVKALPCRLVRSSNLGMQSSKDLAVLLRTQMAAKGTKPAELAELCGVKAPSVYDWINYGRIAKKHIPRLAEFFGTPLGYWLGTDEDEDDLDPLERQLLAMYRALDQEFRDRLLQDANHLLNLQAPPKPSAADPFNGNKPPTPPKKK